MEETKQVGWLKTIVYAIGNTRTKGHFILLHVVTYVCALIYQNTYVRVASRNRTLGTLKRNGFFAISVYLHAFCTILRSLVALGTSAMKK